MSPHEPLSKHGKDKDWLLERYKFASTYALDAAVEEIEKNIEKNINYNLAAEFLATALVYQSAKDPKQFIPRLLDYVAANKVSVSKRSMTLLFNSVLGMFHKDTPDQDRVYEEKQTEGSSSAAAPEEPSEKVKKPAGPFSKKSLLAFCQKALTLNNALQTWIIAKRASNDDLLSEASSLLRVHQTDVDPLFTCQIMRIMTDEEGDAFIRTFGIGASCP